MPFGLAADSFSIPFCIVEQNAVMGTANRVSAFAKTIFLNFDETTYSTIEPYPLETLFGKRSRD